jgi:hypothetical protein
VNTTLLSLLLIIHYTDHFSSVSTAAHHTQGRQRDTERERGCCGEKRGKVKEEDSS